MPPHEMSKSRRLVKLKGVKKEIFPFIPSRCGLGQRRISILPGFHKVVSFHNYGISSRSRVQPLINAPRIPPHKPLSYSPIMHHSPCLPDIQTSLIQAVLHCINSSLRSLPTERLQHTLLYNPLSNPVILHPLHMVEPSENTLINLFVYTLCHSKHSGLYPFS